MRKSFLLLFLIFAFNCHALEDLKSMMGYQSALDAAGQKNAIEEAKKHFDKRDTLKKESDELRKSAAKDTLKIEGKPETKENDNKLAQSANEKISKANQKDDESEKEDKLGKDQLKQMEAFRKNQNETNEGIKKIESKKESLEKEVKSLRDSAESLRRTGQTDAAAKNEAAANSIEKGELAATNKALEQTKSSSSTITSAQDAISKMASDPNSLVSKFVSPELADSANNFLSKVNEASANNLASNTESKLNNPNLGYSNGEGLQSVKDLAAKEGTTIPANADGVKAEVFKDGKTSSIWQAPEGYNKLSSADQLQAFKDGKLSYLQDGKWVKSTPTWDNNQGAWNLGNSNNNFWRPGNNPQTANAGLFNQTGKNPAQNFSYYSGITKTDNSNPIVNLNQATYKPKVRTCTEFGCFDH